MSRLLTIALLGSAVIAGSVSGVALAQDSGAKVKPCIGDLCPPKASGEDMPKQPVAGTNQPAQMKGQHQASGQVMPRKKKQAGLHRNRQQQASGQVVPRKKKQASLQRNQQQQQPSKKSASRSSFWDWLF